MVKMSWLSNLFSSCCLLTYLLSRTLLSSLFCASLNWQPFPHSPLLYYPAIFSFDIPLGLIPSTTCFIAWRVTWHLFLRITCPYQLYEVFREGCLWSLQLPWQSDCPRCEWNAWCLKIILNRLISRKWIFQTMNIKKPALQILSYKQENELAFFFF